MAKKITLTQIAEHAGVSVGTVSKVLNRKPGIGVEGRARVRRAVEELGYVPKDQADTSKRIMVIFDAIDSPYASVLLSGIISASAALGFDVVISSEEALRDSMDGDHLGGWLREGHDVDGYILATIALTPELAKSILSIGLPVVIVDPVNTVPSDVVKIGATNWHGGYSATEHLAELGHTRIGHITGPVLSTPATERHEGYRSALRAHGLDYDPSLVRTAPFTFDGGLHAGGELLDLTNPPTAIFAASDATALGVYEAARRRGIAIPEQLSVVGFDNTYAAEQSAPLLTTVQQPIRDMGSAAARTVARLLRHPEDVSSRVQLETTLIMRDSTAPPS